jgi:O-antigen ligase
MKIKRILEISSLSVFMVLAISTCVSKSMIDITCALLLLLSLIYMIIYKEYGCVTRNRHMIVLLIPLAIGLFFGLFSLAGPFKGAAGFLERYRFFFMILPFTLFVRSEKNIHILFALLNLSAVVSLAYGISQLDFPNIWGRTIGYYPILRQANMLMCIVLINLAGLFCHRLENRAWNITSKVLVGANTLLMMAAVILMLRRSAYLGFVVGIFTFLLVMRKRKILTLVVIALCLSLYLSDSVVVQRVKSIVDFKDNNSNRERIQLLRTGSAYIMDEGLFFHGTGAKMSVEPYTEYFYSHRPEYQEENSDIIRMDFFGNFHNSFLQMAVEYGVFYLLCYLISILCILIWLFRSLPNLPPALKVYPTAAIAATAGFFVSQFFHTNLYSYGALPFLLAFSAGCTVVNQHRTKMPEAVPVGVSNAASENDGH